MYDKLKDYCQESPARCSSACRTWSCAFGSWRPLLRPVQNHQSSPLTYQSAASSPVSSPCESHSARGYPSSQQSVGACNTWPQSRSAAFSSWSARLESGYRTVPRLCTRIGCLRSSVRISRRMGIWFMNEFWFMRQAKVFRNNVLFIWL